MNRYLNTLKALFCVRKRDFDATNVILKQTTRFWRKKRDFDANNVILTQKTRFLRQKHEFDAKHACKSLYKLM